MKIRIRGNSIRLRLTRTEVETFCAEGEFGDKTEFGTNSFFYVLKAKDKIKHMEASFKENTITVFMPAENCNSWANSATVGYNAEMPLSNGQTLKILVEKDFVCLDERLEDQSDNYPNPKL